MATRIYVGNLPFTVTTPELSELFGQMGKVNSADVVLDAYDGRSRGFGFVEMAEEHDANRAVSELHGADYKGRTLKVNVARPRGQSRYAAQRESRLDNRYATGYGQIYGKDLSRGNW